MHAALCCACHDDLRAAWELYGWKAFLFVFETGSPMAQAGLEPTYVDEDDLELLTFCLNFSSARITGMDCHSWPGGKH